MIPEHWGSTYLTNTIHICLSEHLPRLVTLSLRVPLHQKPEKMSMKPTMVVCINGILGLSGLESPGGGELRS